MTTTHFIAAGASRRPNIMDKIDNVIAYASIANIILVSTNRKMNVIIRNLKEEITFLYTQNNHIVICDIIGNIEVYILKEELEFKLIHKFCIDKALYGVSYDEKGSGFVGIGIDEFYLISNNDVTEAVTVDNLLTIVRSVEINNKLFHVFGYDNGTIEIYDKDGKCKVSNSIHQNAIKCLRYKIIKNAIYFVSSSLDLTIKVWRLVLNGDELELCSVDILYGHVDWILGCNWTENDDIISCSSDNNVIIWKKEGEKWSLDNKLGGLFEKAQTFYNCIEVDHDIFAQSISGGIYRYKNNGWSLTKFVSGHVDEITSIDVYEDMIMTTSLDYTTRIFSHELCEEIGRPQIHGHPILCARFLKSKPLQIVSGADETILRVLRATELFNTNYIDIMNKHLASKYLNKSAESFKELNEQSRNLTNSKSPKMARLSELSLTTEVFDDNYDEILKEGNSERNLSMNFLFAEINKLYGHFFEITDIAVSKNFIISANKSTTQKFSGIFVWDYEFNKTDYIPIHDLGIQRLKFSSNGQFIIACSRDTTVSLYKLQGDKFNFLTKFTPHKRIVWDCDISYDNALAASCSRDKKLYIYDLNTFDIKESHAFDHEITSLCFHKSRHIICIGLADGNIHILDIDDDFRVVMGRRVHSGIVKCLSFFSETEVCSGGSDGMFVISEFYGMF